jgi:hypothetical protein
MKKFGFLVGLLAIGSTLFAQKVSLIGHLATDFDAVAPTLGFEVNFNKIDLLAEANFWIYSSERADKDYQNYNTDSTSIQNRFEIFAGIAPKVIITENWSLTFPLLAKLHFRNDELKYHDSFVYTTDSAKKADYFGYGFDIGARVYYALSQRWNIYAGFLFEIVSISNNKYTYWKTANTTWTREYNTTLWFNNGEFELGVRYTF